MPHSPTRALLAAAALTGLVVLSACSASGPAASQVASLPSAGSTAGSTTPTTTAAGDDSGRPQLRLDSSDADRNALLATYYACLKQHGHRMITGVGDAHAGVLSPDGKASGDAPDMNDDSPASKTAETACAQKLPLQPPEMDQSKNPHYLDDFRAYVSCLNAHGVPVHATDPFGSGWTFNDGVTTDPTQLLKKVDQPCQIASFSK